MWLRSQLANFSQFWSKFCHLWDHTLVEPLALLVPPPITTQPHVNLLRNPHNRLIQSALHFNSMLNYIHIEGHVKASTKWHFDPRQVSTATKSDLKLVSKKIVKDCLYRLQSREIREVRSSVHPSVCQLFPFQTISDNLPTAQARNKHENISLLHSQLVVTPHGLAKMTRIYSIFFLTWECSLLKCHTLLSWFYISV